MKAAVLKRPGDLEVVSLKTPKCGADEILVRVKATGICSSDIKMASSGHRDLVLPRILGHEVSGTILEVGKDVKDRFKKDMRVQIAPGIACGRCFWCLKGAQNMCDKMKVIGFHYDGGFAEVLRLPREVLYSKCVNLLPEKLSFEEAIFAEPIACCLNALGLMNLMTTESVLIFGAGTMGCLFIQLTRLFGASRIIVAEKKKERLNFSKRFGADHYIEASNPGRLSEEVNEITKGKGTNNVILACSDKSLPRLGLDILSKRGCISFFSGLMPEESKVLIDYNLIHYKEFRLTGAYGCTSPQNTIALSLLAKRDVKVKDLLTQRINLDEIKKGMEIVKNRGGMKIVINDFQ